MTYSSFTNPNVIFSRKWLRHSFPTTRHNVQCCSKMNIAKYIFSMIKYSSKIIASSTISYSCFYETRKEKQSLSYDQVLFWKDFALFYYFGSFSHGHKLMVFHWRLSDSKFPQVYKTLLCILADLNVVVVWTVSTCLQISKSSSPLTNSLGIDPSALIAIGITVTFMLQRLLVLKQGLYIHLSICFQLIFFSGPPIWHYYYIPF